MKLGTGLFTHSLTHSPIGVCIAVLVSASSEYVPFRASPSSVEFSNIPFVWGLFPFFSVERGGGESIFSSLVGEVEGREVGLGGGRGLSFFFSGEPEREIHRSSD